MRTTAAFGAPIAAPINRRRFTTRVALFYAAASLSTLAQAQSAVPASTNPVVDQNGVDLIDGSFNFARTDISVGPLEDGGLSYVRQLGVAGLTSNMTGLVDRRVEGPNTYVYVTFGTISEKFLQSGSSYTPVEANGSTLTANTVGSVTTYLYTARDGTKAGFTQSASPATPSSRIDYVLTPTGDRKTFTYKSELLSGTTYERLQSVNSNLGWQLKLTYASNVLSAGTLADWRRVANVMAINNVHDYCAPAVDTCVGLSLSWPSVSYGQSTSGTDIILTATDALNRTWRYTQNASGKITAIRRPSSGTDNVIIAYDGSGRVQSVTNGGTWTYGYVDAGAVRTTTVTDPLSHTRVVISDTTKKRVTSDQNGAGKITSYQYDANNRLTRVTQPEGNYVQLTPDSRGNVTQMTQVAKSGSGLANIVTSAVFPASCTDTSTCNKPTSTTDAAGKVTDYTYNANQGTLATATLPPPSVGGIRPQSRFSYTPMAAFYKDSSGTIQMGNGVVYRLVGLSQCMTTASCAGTADEVVSSLSYQSTPGIGSNLQSNSYSFATLTTANSYDPVGNLLSSDGPLAGTADTRYFRYDLARQLVGGVTPDPDGAGSLKHQATRYSYDLDGQITAVEQGTVNRPSDVDWFAFVSLQQQSRLYDTVGRQIRMSWAAGGTTQQVEQYSYDSDNRLRCSTLRMNRSIYGSLPGDACTTGTTGSFGPDRITRYSYDGADRVTQVEEGVGGPQARTTAAYAYTNNGQIASLTDARGYLATYTYDGFDRQTRWSFPSSTVGVVNASDYVEWGYDPRGLVTSSRTRANETTSYGYDDIGRRTSANRPGAELDSTFTYDNLGRMLTSVLTGGHTSTFVYDKNNRLLSEAGPLGTVSSQYDDGSRRTRITHPDSTYFTYDYDLLDRPTRILENGSTATTAYVGQFAYDDLGQRTSLTRGAGSTLTTTSYGYDAMSRLVSLSHNLDGSGTTSDLTLTLGYNPAQQIARRLSSNSAYGYAAFGSGSPVYAPNHLNQYTTVGGGSLTYDGRGNLASYAGVSYAYDSQNRLLTVSGGLSSSLSYDPMGRLYRVTGGTTPRRFLYDGQDVIGEYNDSGTLLRRYVHAGEIDQPLAWYEGATAAFANRRYLHADERGSVVAITDANGTTLNKNSYDDYGVPAAANVGAFQYTGQAWLPEAGVYHLRARNYLPTIGRFMQTDPIEYEGGINLYAYVANDPINSTDPLGLCDVDICVTAKKKQAEPAGFPGAGYVSSGNRQAGNKGSRNGSRGAGGENPPQKAQTPACPKGGRITLGIGGSASGAFLYTALGIGAEVGISIPTDFFSTGSLRGAQFYGSASFQGLVGFGFFAGAGVTPSAGYSSGPTQSGASGTRVVGGGAALGGGGEISVATNGSGGSISGGPRAGVGAYAGYGGKVTATAATPQLGCTQ